MFLELRRVFGDAVARVLDSKDNLMVTEIYGTRDAQIPVFDYNYNNSMVMRYGPSPLGVYAGRKYERYIAERMEGSELFRVSKETFSHCKEFGSFHSKKEIPKDGKDCGWNSLYTRDEARAILAKLENELREEGKGAKSAFCQPLLLKFSCH